MMPENPIRNPDFSDNDPYATLGLMISRLSDRDASELVCRFAERVLPFLEEIHPEERRPQEAVSAKRSWMRGDIGDDELVGFVEESRNAGREIRKTADQFPLGSEKYNAWCASAAAGAATYAASFHSHTSCMAVCTGVVESSICMVKRDLPRVPRPHEKGAIMEYVDVRHKISASIEEVREWMRREASTFDVTDS